MPNYLDLDGPNTVQPIWSRQPGETDSQYTLFLRYLGLAIPRYLSTLAKEANYSEHTVREYSMNGLWRQRAGAYDANELELNRLARQQSTANLRDQIISDEFQDAKLMLEKWRTQMTKVNGDTSTKEFGNLVVARTRIGTLIRLAAEMPLSILPSKQRESSDSESENWELSAPNASETTHAPSLPGEDQETPGEVQGIRLWSEMGEEFPGEE